MISSTCYFTHGAVGSNSCAARGSSQSPFRHCPASRSAPRAVVLQIFLDLRVKIKPYLGKCWAQSQDPAQEVLESPTVQSLYLKCQGQTRPILHAPLPPVSRLGLPKVASPRSPVLLSSPGPLRGENSKQMFCSGILRMHPLPTLRVLPFSFN